MFNPAIAIIQYQILAKNKMTLAHIFSQTAALNDIKATKSIIISIANPPTKLCAPKNTADQIICNSPIAIIEIMPLAFLWRYISSLNMIIATTYDMLQPIVISSGDGRIDDLLRATYHNACGETKNDVTVA